METSGMETLSIDTLRHEMESGIYPDNAFLYKRKMYYFFHSFNDGRYHFGVLHTSDTDQEFPDFDSIMDAHLVGDKPFREMLPELVWY